MRTEYIIMGLGLLGVAVAPTPDDITIISPAVQTIAGLILVIYGLGAKK